jgi:tripartite-type tricarboxylate transporter receptor subunit TctC
MGRVRSCVIAAAAAASVCAASIAAEAQSFAGKTITIIVSTGGDDSYGYIARTFAQHMPRYIPGQPTMIVKAMPGAGNVLATNHLYNIAPKDGTTIGTINNAIPLHQVLDGRGVHYDASKFNWLGSTGTYNSVAYVWHSAGIKTIQDVMAREVILGGTGAGSSIVIYPTVMNNVLGTKFKIVLGYKSVSEINVAMERGEVQARTGSYADLQSEHQDWLDQRKVVLLTQIGSKPDKAIPAGVPLVIDLAKSEEQRQILKLIASPIGLGRPYLAPPDTDKDRVALLRKAFADTMRDKGFLADAAKLKIDIDPVSGDEIAQIVSETIGAAPDIVAKAKAAMGEGAASQ